MALNVGAVTVKLDGDPSGLVSAGNKANMALAGVNKYANDVKTQGLKAMNDGFDATANIMKTVVIGAGALGLALVSLGFNNSIKIQSAMADVQKSAGLTKDEVGGLRDQILDLGVTTSTDSFELIGIAKIGGQIGVAKEELLAFTGAIDKVSTALGDEFTGGAEEVSSKLGTLRNLFKDTSNVAYGDAMLKIGSAINSLGATGTATGPVVAEFASRIGQLGNMAPSITQTLGLGAAMQELGLSAEISSGGLTNIFLTAGEKSKVFAKQLGLSEQAFKDLYKASPNDMLLKLAESLRGVANDPVKLAQKMRELGIGSQESVKVLGLLATKTDMVRDKQALASAEFEKGTSILDEYNIKNNTFEAVLGKAKNMFTKFSSALWNADLGKIGEQFGDMLNVAQELFAVLTGAEMSDGGMWIDSAFGSGTANNLMIIRNSFQHIGYALDFIQGKEMMFEDSIGSIMDVLNIFGANVSFQQVESGLNQVRDAWSWVSTNIINNGPLMRSVMFGLGTTVGVMVVGAFLSMAGAVILATWPFFALAAIIGVLYYLWVTNFGGIQQILAGFLIQINQLWAILQPILMDWGNIIMTQVWPAVVQLWGALVNLWNFLSPVLIPVLQFVAIAFGVYIVGAIYAVLYGVTFLYNGIAWLVNGFIWAVNWIVNKVTYMKNNFWESVGAIIGFFATLPIKIPLFIASMIGNMINYLRGIDWGGVWRGITDTFQNAWNNIVKWFSGINWGSMIGGAIKSGANGVIGLIEGALRGALSGIPGVPQINLPRFAKGVRNFEGGVALVGEEGPELVNLPNGSDVLTNKDTMQAMSGGNSKNPSQESKTEKHFHFHFDDIVFADDKNIRDLARRVKRVFAEEGI